LSVLDQQQVFKAFQEVSQDRIQYEQEVAILRTRRPRKRRLMEMFLCLQEGLTLPKAFTMAALRGIPQG
jgi:hypothetical protein